MIDTSYYAEWQQNRINFILSKYSEKFFIGKRVLELGAYNGYIGARLALMGAEVHCVEGRSENVANIKNDYPQVTVEVANLDSTEWKWGKWDIIINFGLYYHLENYHKEHLKNCIDNCDLMFFESVIYDSDTSEIHFREERGDDQSLTSMGGIPSTSYVEEIFKINNKNYEIFKNKELNGNLHHYDWNDANTKKLDVFARRFWIVK
jgi:2-polyprenyl-3-methyl-5-hydroxy-6-metoxy-1,4-benzoquinol methylase